MLHQEIIDASDISTQISLLDNEHQFVHRYASGGYAHDINILRERILLLGKDEPLQAIELLEELLDSHLTVYECCDDSDGVVAEAYEAVLEDLGKLYYEHRARFSQEHLIQEVVERMDENPFGIHDNVIPCFKEALGEVGLHELARYLREKHAESGSSVQSALEQIADALNDVDGYIALVSAGRENVPSAECRGIAERLFKHKRFTEALDWLAKIELGSSCKEVLRLKIDVLSSLERHQEAHVERLHYFELTLSADMYQEIMQNSDEALHAELYNHAVQCAHAYERVNRALEFLMALRAYDQAALLVMNKHQLCDYNYYYSTALRLVAQTLGSHYPLAATLLYRRMIDAVLTRGKAEHYKDAVSDLLACQKLADAVQDWGACMPHGAYFENIEKAHKRRIALWRAYQEQTSKIR